MTFPNIPVEPEYSHLRIIDSDNRLLFTHDDKASLLYPLNIRLSDFSQNIDKLKQAISCIEEPDYVACQYGPLISRYYEFCLKKLIALNYDDDRCFSRNANLPTSRFSIPSGTLLRSKGGAIIRELATGRLTFRSQNSVCKFLPESTPVEIQTPYDFFDMNEAAPVFETKVATKLPNRSSLNHSINTAVTKYNLTHVKNDNPLKFNDTTDSSLDTLLRFVDKHPWKLCIAFCVFCVTIFGGCFLSVFLRIKLAPALAPAPPPNPSPRESIRLVFDARAASQGGI